MKIKLGNVELVKYGKIEINTPYAERLDDIRISKAGLLFPCQKILKATNETESILVWVKVTK